MRTSVSVLSCSQVAARPSYIRHVMALRACGRSNRIVATAPSRTKRTSPSFIGLNAPLLQGPLRRISLVTSKIDIGRAVLFVISKAGADYLFALVAQMGAQNVRKADTVAP